MDRRQFFGALLGLGAARLAPAREQAPRRLVLQESPVAGFQFHDGAAAWPRLAEGAKLRLVREADNRHDDRAVTVWFGDRKLGYVPRKDNAAVAQLLDRGEALEAAVTRLTESPDPWERVRFEVRWKDKS